MIFIKLCLFITFCIQGYSKEGLVDDSLEISSIRSSLTDNSGEDSSSDSENDEKMIPSFSRKILQVVQINGAFSFGCVIDSDIERQTTVEDGSEDEDDGVCSLAFLADDLSSDVDELRRPSPIKRRKLEPLSKMVRSSSDGSSIYFDSQPLDSTTYLPYSGCSRCISVHTFLRKCAKFIGIDGYTETESPFFLPEYYDESDIISVSLWENGKLTYYRVYDPGQRLMNKGKFNPKEKPLGGSRETGFFWVDETTRLFFKESPEAPERENMVPDLYQRIFPEDKDNMPFAKSKTIRMNDKIFLIAEFIEGKTLEEVFRKVKENPEYGKDWIFNKERFQKLLLFCALICPEDLRPQNCLIRKMKDSDEYEFVLIDNERCLAEDENFEFDHFERGKIRTRVHCVLLCFHELMRSQINVRVSEDIHGVVHRWTSKYYMENKSQKQLQAQLREEDLSEMASGIFYGHKRKRTILQQLRIIEKSCSVGQEFSTVLRSIMPELAEIYRIPRSYEEGFSSENPLLLAYLLAYDVDRGRTDGVTPNSAYIPLKQYFGSKSPGSKSFCLGDNLSKVTTLPQKLRRQITV